MGARGVRGAVLKGAALLLLMGASPALAASGGGE